MNQVDADRAREKAAAQEKAKREAAAGVGDTGEMARQAFQMIDASGDGEITRTEIIRAFRLNDKVREILLPLLPSEILGRSASAISGVDVQAQVEAFEITFQRMDADGSNAVCSRSSRTTSSSSR